MFKSHQERPKQGVSHCNHAVVFLLKSSTGGRVELISGLVDMSPTNHTKSFTQPDVLLIPVIPALVGRSIIMSSGPPWATEWNLSQPGLRHNPDSKTNTRTGDDSAGKALAEQAGSLEVRVPRTHEGWMQLLPICNPRVLLLSHVETPGLGHIAHKSWALREPYGLHLHVMVCTSTQRVEWKSNK